MVTVVFVLGLEHHWLTLPVIKRKKKREEKKTTPVFLLRMCTCAHAWLLACPSVGGQASLSPPFTQGKLFNLPCRKIEPNQMNEVKCSPSPRSRCIILRCRMGPIFIRASYGASHGQNNISMVVTGM